MDEAPIRHRNSTDRSGHHRDLTYPPLPEPLPVPTYDNHTHLEIADGEGADGRPALSVDEHLTRAHAAGVKAIVQVGTDLATSKWSAELAASRPDVLAAVAIHPNTAPELAAAGVLNEQLAEIDALASQARVRCIGETGLDYALTGEDGQAAQIAAFEAHIEIAKRHNVAMQIHDRNAHDDVVATLERVGAPERTVFHCFSGGPELANICAEHGWYLSFSGTVTFKNAPLIREALTVAPLDHIMVETDAPFLTPVPYRGRPNAPYLVPYTLRVMAEVLDLSVAELAEQVNANTERVYGSWGVDA